MAACLHPLRDLWVTTASAAEVDEAPRGWQDFAAPLPASHHVSCEVWSVITSTWLLALLSAGSNPQQPLRASRLNHAQLTPADSKTSQRGVWRLPAAASLVKT